MNFSQRQGLEQGSQNEIYDDAPEAMRHRFILKILHPLAYIDDDQRYRKQKGEHLGYKMLIDELSAEFGQVPPENYQDSWYCATLLEGLLQSCDWNRFYDSIELIYKLLNKPNIPSDVLSDYVQQVNEMLERFGIGWMLGEEGILEKRRPAELQDLEKSVEDELEDEYAIAKTHFAKARKFLYSREFDYENAVKEIVMAVECVGKIIYKGTATLGDVCKEMKKTGVSSLLTAIIEKFYAYSSAEPGVRHAGITSPKVRQAEAEMCFGFGLALLKYLLGSGTSFFTTDEDL